MNYELVIIGGGPAGAAAAVYAARKRVKTLFITSEWGDQSTVSTDIQNWVGTLSISGDQLAKNLRAHVEAYAGEWLTIHAPAFVQALEPHDTHVDVVLKNGEKHSASLALITTGANRRKLEIPGAAEYDQKGLTYCASCDGPLFADQDVVVIGGGNAGFETALQLLTYCKSVTLLHKGEQFRADKISVDAALANPKMRGVLNAEPVEIVGDKFVTGVKWKDSKTGEVQQLPATGVFVEIGLIPNTAWAAGAVEQNEMKQIKADPRTQRTSHPRVWAAGDCTDGLYHQNNIAAGDAVRALEDIYMNLRKA